MSYDYERRIFGRSVFGGNSKWIIAFERVGKYGSTEELLVYLGESRIGIGSFERIMRGIHGTREEWISLLHFYQVSRVTDQLNWH